MRNSKSNYLELDDIDDSNGFAPSIKDEYFSTESYENIAKIAELDKVERKLLLDFVSNRFKEKSIREIAKENNMSYSKARLILNHIEVKIKMKKNELQKKGFII